MAQPNEVYDTIMRELNVLVLSDTDESKEQQSFSFHEEAGFDDIPPSLLSYFETSKSRAAVCEKLILEDLEDFTVSHHPEDMTNLSIGLDKDMIKLNEQVICDLENEEKDNSFDTHLHASTETEALSDRLCTYNIPLCSNSKDEAGTNMESEEHLLFETRTLDISLDGEERKKLSEYEEERKKQQYEEMKLDEQKRQIERDFQEELRKIMEAEKLHQKEIELMEKRAQEKLQQEFLLQQELISSLQRQVKEERRMKEEEQNRMKRKREEEKVKMEAEKRRMEEERKMREEEDKRKREEEKVKMEAERRRRDEERKMREEEDKRKREEEKVKMEAKRKRQQEERRIREEEQKRMKEEEDKRKREEETVKIEAERKRQEEERRIREEEQRRVKEEEDKRKRQEEKVKIEAERKRQEEERRIREEEQRRMKEEEDKRKREEEKVKMEAERKRQEDERRIREEAQRRMKEEEDKRKREEEKVKMEADRKRKEEETRRKKEEEIIIEEMKCKKGEEERRRMEREEKWREEERIMIDLERRKLENEVRMMQEEQKKERAEEVERGKEDKIEEATKEMEKMETARKGIIEIRLKKEDECRTRKERKDKEGRVTEEIKERKEQVGETEKKKEADDRKKMAQEKMDEEMRNGDKNGNIDEEIKLKRKKTEEMHRKRLEEEKDRKNMEEGKDSKEVVRNQEGENRKIEEERRPIVKDEKNADERKTEEEERGRRQTEKMRRQRNEDNYRKSEEDMRLKEENDLDNRKREHESKTKDKEEERRKRDEGNTDSQKEQNGKNVEENKEEVNKTMGEEMRIKEKEKSKNRMMQVWEKEVKVVKAHELQKKREEHSMKRHNEKKHTYKRENSSPREDSTSWSFSSLESIICPDGTDAIPQQDLNKKISQTSARLSTGSVSLPVCLPEHTEQRRLSWMKDCIPWSKLSLKNRRKQNGSARSRRVLRRAAEASSLPPLCPESLLQSTGWKSLHEVTTVSLEDLPGCSLSTLAQCTQLRSLSLRRCSLKSLEGINHLPQLCYIDVQENDISFINCENMISLRVLKLEHNKLTSIHGLAGAENLDVLHLSHNSITRIAGLESVRRLQRLSLDHNQLISTKGLRDVYTLLHLNCSHNHLASVEGLENSALLNTLDLRANSLTEPPSLNNHVLLRELQLDDNSISSLQSLTACWLPLLQHLSVAQNRITQLPSVSDFVSLENLDLRFNCMSELQTVCESLEGCHLLQKVHLTGNPLQQESGWRSTLQKAVPGLRVIDDQWTDSSLSPPAAQQVTLASGSFLAFCQAQLQQTHDLQQQHSRELSKASSPLDAVNISCQHFTEALQLAADQRFAHEYGDTNVADKHRAASQTIPEETVDMGSATAEKHSECPEIESTEKVPPVRPISDNIGYSTFDEKSDAESRHDTFYTDATPPQTGPAVSKVNSGSVNSLVTKRKANSTNLKIAPVLSCQDLDRRIAAAVVIQQLWRKYRQKCGNISSPSTAEKRGGRGGDGVMPRPGPSYINGSVVGQDHAATVIQAFWRGFTLRRRFASALAAVTCSDSGEDDTLEEVDMDEFVLDEAALEKHWTLPLCEDPPLRRYPVSEQPLSLRPPQPFPEPSQYILPQPVERKSKQAWVAPEQVDSERQGVSTFSSNRSKSPASTSVVSGLSKRSEKILEEWGFTNHHTALLMLKRAQNMKSKKHQQKRRREPSVRLALFRNCSFQPDLVEARHSCNVIKVGDVELGLQQAERTERVKSDQARQWLHNQTAHSDRDSESVRFLPEISSDILNGGRVQLVADPGYTERLHHASGLWANSSLTAQPRRENNHARRNSLGHAREDVPSPRGATSAPSIKERISFRDNPVQLSSGWGGGKKRGKVYK